MANKYAQYSKVDEALVHRRRMAGALRTCARKKTFSTYEAAAKWGEPLKLNPYTCPWCDKFHLTRKEGDKKPKKIPGGVSHHYSNCVAQINSQKAGTVIKGVALFSEIAFQIDEERRKEILKLLNVTKERINTLEGGNKVKRRLVKKINAINEFHS